MVQNADSTAQPIWSKYVSPSDWPWTLSEVVREARRILSYFGEGIPEEARPPESLWHSPHKCTDWIMEHHPYIKDKKSSGGMLEFSDREIERK